jgi:PAS domain S-box-containing protein
MSDTVPPPDLSSHTTDPRDYEFSYREVQQLIDAIDTGWIFPKNRDGEYILNNEKHARESKGMSPEELRGLSNVDFTDADAEDEKVQADDQRILDEGERDVIPQERVTGDDGTEYILRTVKEAFDSDISEQDTLLGIATDISDWVDTEKVSTVHDATQAFIGAGTAAEIADIAIRTIEDVLALDYCTVWTAEEIADQIEQVARANDDITDQVDGLERAAFELTAWQ